MQIKLGYLAPLIGAAAVAAAISAAPLASADTAAQAAPTQQQSCGGTGAGTVCQSPGNVQINDAPPPVQYYPYGGEAFLL